jgi:hypothetical protein
VQEIKLDSNNYNSDSKITLHLSCERYGKGADAHENSSAKISGRIKVGKTSSRCLDEVNRSARKVQLKLRRRKALHDR